MVQVVLKLNLQIICFQVHSTYKVLVKISLKCAAFLEKHVLLQETGD